MCGDFDVVAGSRVESTDGVGSLPRGDVVADHGVLGDDVPPVFEDIVEDVAASVSERIQLNRDERFVHG